MSSNIDLLLLGAGPMAISYVAVLNEQKIAFDVVGRGERSSREFEAKTGTKPVLGLENYFRQAPTPSHAIVAVSAEMLSACTQTLLEAGVKNILLEKPGGLSKAEIQSVADLSLQNRARVVIGYNRRYYSSVEKAREMIAEDGGLKEVYFEFTEWSDQVEKTNKPSFVKQKWFLANSTHVVDLAFHFAGVPVDWCHYISGGNNWHPSATRFVGSGLANQNVLFSYQADWESAGRWGVELLTSKRRLFLRPMEELFVQKLYSTQIEPVALTSQLDQRYKPGLYKEVSAFLEKDDRIACTIDDQLNHFKYYNAIAGYFD